tara:strand:- start:57 stop:332 length:276 start_codon:yes stop_codon:yes gene_type:complete
MEYLLGIIALIIGYGFLKILAFIVIACLVIWFIYTFFASIDKNEETRKSSLQAADDVEEIGGKALDLFGKIFFFGLAIIIIVVVILVLNIL